MSTPVQWLGDSEAKPAPDPLRRVQGLINTIDRESGDDRLAHPADAQPWMVTNNLLTAGASPDEAELQVLVGVREALRALVIQNSGGPVAGPTATAPLRDALRDVALTLTVDADGQVAVLPVGESVPARLAALLLVVEVAQRDGTWTHLKACANDECQWVFYDRSRNHGGTWCDMSSCGNKLKNREFRARRRTTR